MVMSMHRIVLAALVATLPGIVAKAQESAFYELAADGEVQIAPDGHVSDYHLKGELAPTVAELVRRNVMSWQFEPILLEGKAVVAKTAMHLGLRADKVSGKNDEFSVSIASIDFGAPTRSIAGNAPRYPRNAAHARLGAKVVLSARLDENGKVVEATPYQTSLDARASGDNEAEKWRREFEKASIAAVMTWRYDLSETIGGRKIGTSIYIPISYSISASPTPAKGAWNGYIPGPIHPAPWIDARGDDVRVAQLDKDEAISTSSRFHLKNDVIGKAL
jgi:hypothetical protein